MTSSTRAARASATPWSRVRGALASVAVAGFLGIAVVAPMTTASAVADEAFYERIHQEFVPEFAEGPAINLAVSPLEEPPKPPAPTVAPAGGGGDPAPPVYTGGGSPAEWMAAAGIAKSDWDYVDAIVQRESGWNPNATNASSGACGLVQALPCSKVPGSGYNPVDNLRWADGYAKGRYGSWAGAYKFWDANHWW